MKKGMFAYRNGMTYNGYDKTFFIEMTNSCRFNCSGCNILKNLEKKIEISVKNFKKIVKFINIFMNNDKYCIGLGTGDFISTVSDIELEKYIVSGIEINEDITLSLLGNYSTEIISNRKLETIKKYYDNLTIGIVFNPLMDKENKKIFLKNINLLKDILDFRDVPIFLNLSSYYFKDKNTIDIIFKFLKEIANIVKLNKIESLTLIFNPNKLLIYKEGFQIDLKTQTEWYLDFWKRKDGYIKNITYENIVKNYVIHKDIRILPHFIDKNMNFYISLEHIGDFPLTELTGFKKIFNIKKIEFNNEEEVNKIIKNINQSRIKITINNKKKLLKDKICKNCEYLDFCSKQSIAINKEIYKNTILGQETNEYCLGHKKLNNFIINKMLENNRN